MKQSGFGACVRSLRKQRQLTQKQFADQLGVTDKAVSKWERGLSLPDITLFPEVAGVLGVSVEDLLEACSDICRPSRLLQAFELSRDIRTPLHIMLGFEEIARQHVEDPELLRRYLEGIRVSGEYLMFLLDSAEKVRGAGNSGSAGGSGNSGSAGGFGNSGSAGGSGNTGNSDDAFCDTCGGVSGRGYPSDPAELEAYLREKVLVDMAKLGERSDFDFTGKRVLVVDDMAVNREIASEVLKQTGAVTEPAGDGAVCLEKVKAMPAGYYDLILMDLSMPRMDGLEAARAIRALPDREKACIPIIALTTNVTEQDRKAAEKAGMDDFAEKPILVERLFRIMEKYLGGRS